MNNQPTIDQLQQKPKATSSRKRSRQRVRTSECAGWFKAKRSNAGPELIYANPCAFILLYVIAHRANWHGDFNRYGLKKGEALLGDFENCGLTHRQYRTAKAQLEKWRFATFEGTSKGTIARLSNSDVFDISGRSEGTHADTPEAKCGQTGGNRATTNKEGKEIYKGKNVKGPRHIDYSKGF